MRASAMWPNSNSTLKPRNRNTKDYHTKCPQTNATTTTHWRPDSGHDDYNQHEQLNDFDHETHDLIEQAGLAIAQEIKEEMLVSGRRRRPL